MSLPNINSLWKHANGQTYRVIMLTNVEADDERKEEYPITVVYEDITSHNVWSKELNAWLNKRTLFVDTVDGFYPNSVNPDELFENFGDNHCVVKLKEKIETLRWCSHYQSWDDKYGDDHFCNVDETQGWKPVSF